VLRVAVPTQIDFPLECFVTETTGERLVAGVFPHVCDEVRRLTECLLAYYAFVGLLTCNKANCEQIYKSLVYLGRGSTSLCKLGRSEGLTAMLLKVKVVWDVTLFRRASSSRRFDILYYLHRHGEASGCQEAWTV